MLYNVNVYQGQTLFQTFVVEALADAQALEVHYEALGFDVYVQPDTMAYIRKYGTDRQSPPTAALAY